MKHTAVSSLRVVARSPFKLHYEGEATAVTATNLVGTFDVLPGHADFFSILQPGQVIIDPLPDKTADDKAEPGPDGKPKPGSDGKPIVVKITNGIIAVRDNKVMVFLNM